jgi:hypothetical protein
MSGGSAAGTSTFQTPLSAYSAENNIFAPLPYSNTGTAANNAYSGIGGINTNPQGSGGIPAFSLASQNLVDQGTSALGQANQLYGYGNTANQQAQTPIASANQAYSAAPYQLNATVPQGQQAYNQGQQEYGQGQTIYQQAVPYAWQALQQGFDPQNALYNQQYAQNLNQTNAINAMSGVGASPYGAGISAQSGQNFNLNWQNQQLQREATAAQAAGSLYGAGTAGLAQGMNAAGQGLQGLQNAYSTGAANYANVMGAGTGAYGAGSNLYGAATGLYGAGNQTLGGAGNAIQQGGAGQQSILQAQQQAQQQQIQDYLAYLQASTGNAQAYTGAVNQSTGAATNATSVLNQGTQQNNLATAGLGSLAGTLGGYLIPPSGYLIPGV